MFLRRIARLASELNAPARFIAGEETLSRNGYGFDFPIPTTTYARVCSYIDLISSWRKPSNRPTHRSSPMLVFETSIAAEH